ncbi:hypothetical protein TWF173_003933 [Orbilia oligospora]|nr:hypothetical protein TWF173_003933 [Orbilia oligospora]
MPRCYKIPTSEIESNLTLRRFALIHTAGLPENVWSVWGFRKLGERYVGINTVIRRFSHGRGFGSLATRPEADIFTGPEILEYHQLKFSLAGLDDVTDVSNLKIF